MSELTTEQRLAMLRARRGQPSAPVEADLAGDAALPAPSSAAARVDATPPSDLTPTEVAGPIPAVATPSARQRLVAAITNYEPRHHPARPARRLIGAAAGAGFLAMLPLMGPLTAAGAEQPQPEEPPTGDDVTTPPAPAVPVGVASTVVASPDPIDATATSMSLESATETSMLVDDTSVTDTLAPDETLLDDPSATMGADPAAAGLDQSAGTPTPAASPSSGQSPAPQAPVATQPGATSTPTATQPPATQPPATAPPATQPPTTSPPATAPPATAPPATAPPATQPPATAPPATAPPATQPPPPPPATGASGA